MSKFMQVSNMFTDWQIKLPFCTWDNTGTEDFIGFPKVVAPGSTSSNLIVNLVFFPQLWPGPKKSDLSSSWPHLLNFQMSPPLSQRLVSSHSRETVVHIFSQPVFASHFWPYVHISEGKESAPYLRLLLLTLLPRPHRANGLVMW